MAMPWLPLWVFRLRVLRKEHLYVSQHMLCHSNPLNRTGDRGSNPQASQLDTVSMHENVIMSIEKSQETLLKNHWQKWLFKKTRGHSAGRVIPAARVILHHERIQKATLLTAALNLRPPEMQRFLSRNW